MIDPNAARSMGISRREQALARQISQQLPNLFSRRKLTPLFSSIDLTRLANFSILLASMDTRKIGDHGPYTHPELLHQLSTDLNGLPVYLSNHTGIRYVFLLSPLPKLPRKIDLPADVPAGKVALGLDFSWKPVVLDWESLRHTAVLGQTGAGKSVFLRSLVYQAIRSGMQLLLADIDQVTFSMLAAHPNLLQPLATTPAAALELIQSALGECDHRASLYRALPGHPEKLSEYNVLAVKHGLVPLPRVLVVLDEASAVLSSMGGGKGKLGQLLAALGWRGRKFGIHFVFGAQEFTKELVGAVREQIGLSVCFRVRSEDMARRMGCKGASRIPEGRPGLAMTDRFGPIQTYFLDKSLLTTETSLLSALPDLERQLFTYAIADGGRIPAARIREWVGASEWQSRRWLKDWSLKGWVAKNAEQDNAFCLTEKGRALLSSASNHQTPQSRSNRHKPLQTVSERSNE